MNARTFRAASMPLALEAVQRELGPEALIISVRQAPGGPVWQVWKQPVVEVVAAASGSGLAARLAVSAPAAPAPKPETPAPVAVQPAEPKPDLAQFKTALLQAASRLEKPAPSAWPPVLAEACGLLAAQGVHQDLVRQVAAHCADSLGPHSLTQADRVREFVRRDIEAKLGPAAPGRKPAPEAQVVCLVGTGGAGKTVTAAKLAAHKIGLGLKAAWICADTVRAGAISQARIYAEAFRLPLRVAYSPEELAQAVAAEAEADLILVDTPGCNPRHENEMVELGALLTALNARTTYLILPATSKDADLYDAVAAFGVFRLDGLVITKLDETGTFGNVVNAAWRGGLPLAYFSAGPRAVDELWPADAGQLAGALFGKRIDR